MDNATHVTVNNNEANQRFEVQREGETAFLEYRWYKGDLALMHTEVPESLEGKGVASALAHHALEYAREKNLKIMVYCPFVAKYLKRHPEYNALIDKRYTG